MAAISTKLITFVRLLFARDPEIEITEALVIAASDTYHNSMAVLFSQDRDIKITEGVMLSTMNKDELMMEDFAFLLDIDPGIQITEAIVIAAARFENYDLLSYGFSDTDSKRRFLREELPAPFTKDPDIEITEAMVATKARKTTRLEFEGFMLPWNRTIFSAVREGVMHWLLRDFAGNFTDEAFAAAVRLFPGLWGEDVRL